MVYLETLETAFDQSMQIILGQFQQVCDQQSLRELMYGQSQENPKKSENQIQPLDRFFKQHALPKTRLRSAMIKQRTHFKMFTADTTTVQETSNQSMVIT